MLLSLLLNRTFDMVIERQSLNAAREKLERACDPIDLGSLLNQFDKPECDVEVSGKACKNLNSLKGQHMNQERINFLETIATNMGYNLITVQHEKLCLQRKDETNRDTIHWNPYLYLSDAIMVARHFNLMIGFESDKSIIVITDDLTCSSEDCATKDGYQSTLCELIVKVAYKSLKK